MEKSKVEIKITCECGNSVSIKRGDKAFYCDRCCSSKLLGESLGFVLPDSDIKK